MLKNTSTAAPIIFPSLDKYEELVSKAYKTSTLGPSGDRFHIQIPPTLMVSPEQLEPARSRIPSETLIKNYGVFPSKGSGPAYNRFLQTKLT